MKITDNPYQLLIKDKAALELKEAYTWYEKRQNGLGEQFL